MRGLLIIGLVAGLAGCAAGTPRPTAFGGNAALSATCAELAGRYLESPSHATGETKESLSSLLGRVLDNPPKATAATAFTLSFPQNRVMRVQFYDPKGQDIAAVDLRESRAEYHCGEGVLEIATGTQRLLSSGSETLTFTRTSGNYLMIRRAGFKMTPIGGIPLPGTRDDWYVFTRI